MDASTARPSHNVAAPRHHSPARPTHRTCWASRPRSRTGVAAGTKLTSGTTRSSGVTTVDMESLACGMVDILATRETTCRFRETAHDIGGYVLGTPIFRNHPHVG